MTKKQLREDIYNDLFDSMRISAAADDSLDDRCVRMVNKIMAHISGQFQPILRRLEFVEDKQIGIWIKGFPYEIGAYHSWNDGEYEISKATKELRDMI